MSQGFEPHPRPRPALWWGILLAVLALAIIGIDYGVWTFLFELRHDIVQTDDDDLYRAVVAAGLHVQALATTVAQVAAVATLALPAILYLLHIRWYGWSAPLVALLMHPTIYVLTRPEFALIDQWTV